MANLVEEYRKRHKIECIWPINEGVLFFERDGQPSLITITSSFAKHLTFCDSCTKNSESMCLEIFKLFRYPYCVQLVSHTHIPPDGNLLDYVQNHVPDGELDSPYISKGERDQERWLWEFFKSTGWSPQIPEWQKFKKDANQDTDIKWLSESFWLTTHHPEVFRRFYDQIYSICMINRRYILVG